MQSCILLIPVYFSWFGWKFALGSYWNCIHCRSSVLSLWDIYTDIEIYIPSFLFLLPTFFLLNLHCLLDEDTPCSWTEARADMQTLCISGCVVLLTRYKTIHYLSQDAHQESTYNRRLEIMKFNSFPIENKKIITLNTRRTVHQKTLIV